MSTEVTTTQSDLPKLKDLVKDIEVYEEQDKLNFLLNQQPPKTWISQHPYIKKETIDQQGRKIRVPYEYLPIDKVEYLLRKIFKQYRIEITGQGQSFNGVYVTVRVHYFNMITNEWDYHDGIGASALQTKSGSSPADLQNINNGALSMAYPLAKTLAIKDATDMFGNLFGANLNRRDTLGASMDEPRKSKTKTIEEQANQRVLNHIKNAKDLTDLSKVKSALKTEEQKRLYTEKAQKLTGK